jgi:hypothetical protein
MKNVTCMLHEETKNKREQKTTEKKQQKQMLQ